jgi:HlyD family secretion protein
MAISSRFFKSRQIRFTTAGLIVILLAATIYFSFTPTTSGPIATAIVQRDRFQVSIKVSGEIRAANSFTLTAPRGRFSQTQIVYLVPEGKTVQSGDTVVRFATTEIDKIIIERESELMLLTSDYQKLQADQDSRMMDLKSALRTSELAMEQAKLQVEKVKFESDVAQKEAEISFERSKLNLEQAKRRIESQLRVDRSEDMKARQKLRQTELDLEKARTERDQLIMKAPMPGLVVYEMNWQTGRKIAIGDAPWSGMAIMSLPDLSKMQTLSSVNEVDISKVRLGQDAEVRLDAFPERAFKATVTSVGTIGQFKERASNNKTFEVVLDIEGIDPILKPGMTTSNEIIMAMIPNAVFIPLEALFEADEQTIVYRMEDGAPKARRVTAGERNSNFVVITKGLSPGDRLTLRDPVSDTKVEEPKQKRARKKPDANR